MKKRLRKKLLGMDITYPSKTMKRQHATGVKRMMSKIDAFLKTGAGGRMT
jgi:hypothetical protein